MVAWFRTCFRGFIFLLSNECLLWLEIFFNEQKKNNFISHSKASKLIWNIVRIFRDESLHSVEIENETKHKIKFGTNANNNSYINSKQLTTNENENWESKRKTISIREFILFLRHNSETKNIKMNWRQKPNKNKKLNKTSHQLPQLHGK